VSDQGNKRSAWSGLSSVSPSDEIRQPDRSQFDHLRCGYLSSLDKQELTLFLEIIPFSSGVVPLAASLLWSLNITLDHND
jgi:hypothetical protein